MQTLTALQLAAMLTTATRNQFASLTYVKEVKCLAKTRDTKTPVAEFLPNGLYCIQTYRNISQLGIGSYENAVNNAREKTGEDRSFESQGLPSWQEPFDGSYTVLKHVSRNTYYFRLRIPKNCVCETVYFDRTGKVYTYEQIDCIVSERQAAKKASTKQSAERQGVSVEDSVKPRTFITANIARLKYNGVEYSCSDAPSYRPAAPVEGGTIAERDDRDENIQLERENA
jgi:hypothetical protein